MSDESPGHEGQLPFRPHALWGDTLTGASRALDRLLLVDDDTVFCAIMAQILGKAGLRVEVAHDGHDCLTRVEDGPFDLVVLDINLPDCRGLDLVPKLAPLPVVFLTQVEDAAMLDTVMREERFALQTVGYVLKPLRPEQVIPTIRHACQLARVIRGYRRLMATSARDLEREKRQLAADLHDEFGQQLVSIRWDVHAIRRLAQSGPDTPENSKLAAKAQAVGEGLEELDALVARTIRQLRPEVLDSLGLERGLRHLVSEWEKRLDAAFTVAIEAGLDAVDPDYWVPIYRVVQEALTNAAKHAHASHMQVTVRAEDHTVQIAVADDGCGFSMDDPDARLDTRQGLSVMRDRVHGLGGTVAIRSARGEGTTVEAAIPIGQNDY